MKPGLLCWLGLVALLGSGCSTGSYYWQAVRGHLQIVSRERSIPDVIADTNTVPEVSEKLKQVLELRTFAERELKLPVDGHYRRYADLNRRFVVWNVHAAPEFSLEAKTWWYPMVGRLKYRGFFSESAAKRLAGRLSKHDQEVFVGGVEAYSTLGWFRDPVLNTFLHHAPPDLAEILFHELAHQKLFVSGDTDFNEAFATSVGQEAAKRWLLRTDRKALLQEYLGDQRREREFVLIVQETRRELAALYRLHPVHLDSRPDPELLEALRRRKSELLGQLRGRHDELRKSWGGISPYASWFSGPLNHPQLNTVATYFDLVPGFERLLRECEGDLPKFYERVRKLGRLSKAERRCVLTREVEFSGARE